MDKAQLIMMLNARYDANRRLAARVARARAASHIETAARRRTPLLSFLAAESRDAA